MLTKEACIQQFLDDNRNRLAADTLSNYHLSIQQLLCYCEKQYNEVTQSDIRNWLIHLEKKKLKASSIQSKLFGLRSFFQYCFEEDLITKDPAESIPLPKVEDKLPHYLTKAQIEQLKKLAERHLKQRAIIEVLYTTAVRVGELANMQIKDIHWSERMITFPEGKGNKKRIALFTKECGEYIKAYLNSRNDELPYEWM